MRERFAWSNTVIFSGLCLEPVGLLSVLNGECINQNNMSIEDTVYHNALPGVSLKSMLMKPWSTLFGGISDCVLEMFRTMLERIIAVGLIIYVFVTLI